MAAVLEELEEQWEPSELPITPWDSFFAIYLGTGNQICKARDVSIARQDS